jgi:eukaryotic-like serine/threonine-protein kinase
VFCGGCGSGLASHGTVPGSPLTGSIEPLPAPIAPPAPAPHPLAGPPIGAPLVKARGPLPTGTIIDQKYAVVRVLGEGGMGVVYLARDIHTGLDVVVKAIRSELAHRADVRQRTLAEGRALAQIDHPNVVHLKSVVVDGTSLWLVMQYIDGESLEKTIAGYVARHEHMPVDDALATLRQIASGLAAAHQEGLIHRDMKPANVLIRRKDGMAKVTDFGIAKVSTDVVSREQTKGILGSLWYMSPEQVTGRRDLDKRVDIYALGIVLYQMLVGDVPFDAESEYEIMRMHAEEPMPRASAKRPDVPAAVDEIIQKACAKDRANRFQSCEELIAAIDHAALRPARTRTIPDSPLPPIETSGAVAASSHDEPPHDRARAAITGQGTEIVAAAPPPAKGRGGLFAVLALLVVAGGAAGAVALGLVPGVSFGPRPRKPATNREVVHPVTSASAVVSAAPAPSAPLPPAKTGIELLDGPWSVNGKDLDAVLVGDVLEFRVRTPSQFEPQGYLAGEARFTLRDTEEPDVFAVEDRIRPFPPVGKTYTSAARNTCQESWTSAGGAPLRARGDSKRLSVDLAKIEPAPDNFTISGSSVTQCRGLRALAVARLVNTLSR